MKNRLIKDKTLLVFLIFILVVVVFKSINIFTVIIQKSNYEESINLLNNQISMTERIKINNEKYSKMDVSYYMNNIYAYCLLKKIKNIQITQKDSKYNKSSSLEITFDLIEKDKFKQMLKDLSFLGFIDSAENGRISLNVVSFSDEEARIIVERGE